MTCMTVLCIFPIKSSNKKGEHTTKKAERHGLLDSTRQHSGLFSFCGHHLSILYKALFDWTSIRYGCPDTDYSASSFLLPSLVLFTLFSEYKLSSQGVIGFSKDCIDCFIPSLREFVFNSTR